MTYRTTLVACAVVGLAAAAPADQIEVKHAKLLEQPKSGSTPVADVKYGDAVQVQKKQGSWWNVKPEDKPAGWIPKSALATGRTQLKAGDSGDTGVSDSEQAAAFRPLTPQAEQAYRKNTPATAEGYTATDKIDASPLYQATDAQVAAFVRDGQLQQGGK